MVRWPFLTMTHQASDSRWRSVDNAHFEFLNNTPVAVGIGIGGYAFEENAGNSIHEWTINNIAMSGNPADVGGAPVDIVLLDIENEFRCCINTDRIATLDVYHTFGLARAATCVKNVKQIFTIHRFTRNYGIFWYI